MKPKNIIHFRPPNNIDVSKAAEQLDIPKNKFCALAVADYIQKLQRMGLVA